MPRRRDTAKKPQQRNRVKEAFQENAERVRALVDSVPPRALRVRYLAPVAVALIGIAVSVLIWRLAAAQETRADAAEFERNAEHFGAAIDRELTENLEVLHSLAAFYNAHGDVDRRHFQGFTQAAVARHASIQALEWIPRVRDSERADYKRAAVQDGLDSFEFTERDGETLVTAATRDEYYPVYFVEPLRANEAAVGFDLASNPARLEAPERARFR
jgi:CHASE1-domain containing sensor protein